MILLALALALAPSADAAERMRVHFIDVGQGAATLVEFPCGAMLVDTGGEESEAGTFHSRDALDAYLQAFFARRTDLHNTLDVLLLTHPHIDHMRGALPTLQKYTVRTLIDNGQTPVMDINKEAWSAIKAYADAHPAIKRESITLASFAIGGKPYTDELLDPFSTCKGVDPEVTALWGQVMTDPGWGEDDYHKARFINENNHSVVTRVDFGQSRLLITGDLEAVAIRDLVTSRAPADLDADIYVVGHHGSYNGTTRELLDAVTPEWAVIEMGPSTRQEPWTAWQYGHPRQATIDLLEAGVSGQRTAVTEDVATGTKKFSPQPIDRAIYATGWDGNVVLEADADGKITVGKADR